jgi:predicted DNA-binding transcriptional regulator YafY
MYKIFNSVSEGAGATVIFSDGTIQQISQDNANYGRVVNTLTSTPVDAIDEEALLALIIPALTVGKSLNRLSERVAFDGTNVLFDGDVVNDAISDHILRIVKEGGSADSYKALVAFMEKLYTNPSEESRNSLYDFIVRHNITIDHDGDFYAYKGVKADSGSIREGFGIVDGVSMNGSLPNKPGSVLEIPRSKVNADNAVGCGTGLHAGTYNYASGWAQGLLLLVKINPRDVVSVPSCSSFQKLRTCRYKVVSQTIHQTQTTTATVNAVTDLNSINNLTKLTEKGDKVPATFTYTRGNGQSVNVSLTVREVRKNDKGEAIVIGEDADGENRSYRGTYITNLVISKDALLKGVGITTAKVLPVRVPAPAQATGDFDALRDGINAGEIVLCDFNYVTVDGEPRRVENFEASTIRSAGWRGHELLVGEREDGETRTYRLDRITDLVVQGSEKEDSAPVQTVSASVSARRNSLDEVKGHINNGFTVVLDFNYTTVAGEPRFLKNFKANEVKGELLLGEREDGENRIYRLDRITDVVIHDVKSQDTHSTVDVASIQKAVVSPAPRDPNMVTHLEISVDKLATIIRNGAAVLINFDYTTVAGESRVVKNFEATDLSGNLLVGEREDGEIRSYRLDRIKKVIMHGVK